MTRPSARAQPPLAACECTTCGTLGCARCHDHKFDPITQADYYRLQAFFANTGADDRIVLRAAGGAEPMKLTSTFMQK